MNRRSIASESTYEPQIGFSRAVRSGRIIAVSGTAPIGCGGDVSRQTRRCIEIVGEALHKAGASLADVIRTRILLVRIEDWEVVGQVHGEFFGSIRPATTIMQVSRFIDPSWLVEIEADAVISDE
jgi:enamine deaminase RidA (YjgF/YER057c/UK114 family)